MSVLGLINALARRKRREAARLRRVAKCYVVLNCCVAAIYYKEAQDLVDQAEEMERRPWYWLNDVVISLCLVVLFFTIVIRIVGVL